MQQRLTYSDVTEICRSPIKLDRLQPILPPVFPSTTEYAHVAAGQGISCMARRWMLLFAMVFALPPALDAQSKGGGAALSGFDSFIMLVPPRDSTTIKKQIR